MIPKHVIRAVNPGTNDEELRHLADMNNLSFNDLWHLRKTKGRLWGRGVAGYARFERNKNRW